MQFQKLVALSVAAIVAGCAQLPSQTGSGKPALSHSEAQAQYQKGLAAYRENRHDAALGDLTQAVASGQLRSADMVAARKHLAFIHCSAGRELPCREQFQAILQAEPDFNLAANEANHPQWGPVWRSIKGALDEKRAISQAGSTNATPAQQKLAEGVKDYEAGRYKEALEALQSSLKAGLPARADELRAHKYAAFSYCLTQRTRQCRAEFRQLFAKDASYELLPSETGHPAWASIYRSEKTAAQKKADAEQKAQAKKTDLPKKADAGRKSSKQ